MSKRRRRIAFVSILICFLIIFILHFHLKETEIFIPSYQKEDISDLIEKKELTSEDYMTIYEQTGVSPYAAKELLDNRKHETLKVLNQLYFQKQKIERNFIAFPTTFEERNYEQITPIANLKKGDILVTFNTHTLGWRHGHCALVLNEENDVLLEHMSLGEVSCTTNKDGWQTYPAFVVLRYKDEQTAQKAAEYAQKNLINLPYNILAGVIKKDKSKEKAPSSHCSHIVWQAYKSAGVDIDNNKGVFVTPKDIAMSENLEIIQIYGINPKNYTDRIKK